MDAWGPKNTMNKNRDTSSLYSAAGRLPEAQPRPGGSCSPSCSPCETCAVRSLSICSGLQIDELVHLDSIVSKVRVRAGGSIFDEGEPATHRYVVTGGCVRIYRLLGDGRRQIFGFLFPGDFLGLAVGKDYAYGAEAVVDSDLCRFPHRELEDLIGQFPELERRLLGTAINELVVAQDQMVLLGRKSAEEKVATMLLTFSKRAEQRGMPANPVSLPMTRADLGDYLGLTTESVSRTMTLLKTDALIRLELANQVHLLDIEKLDEIAQGF
jgi:CRP/FNR family transcriptional regulator